MKQLEKDVIGSMREALAHYDTDPSLARENLNTFHQLFAEHLMEWSEDFAVLWQKMYEIWCAYTPMPKGQYRTTSIEIGYSSFQVKRWINDKVQPPIPGTEELLLRFDRVIGEYARSEKAA